MKTKFILIAGCLATTFIELNAAILQGPVTNPVNGHIYFLLSPNSWTASESEAVQLGGHLATVNDPTECLWLTQTFGEFAGESLALWIGLSDSAEEGTYTWASDEPFNFSYWRNQFPIDPDGTRDFVFIDWSSTIYLGRWRNTSNDNFSDPGLPICGVVEIAPSPSPALSIRPAVEIAWPSATNKWYQIEWASRLNTNDWFSLRAPIAGTGLNLSLFEPSHLANARFYRVREFDSLP